MATTPVNITGATTIVGFTVAPPFSTSDVYTFSFPYLDTGDFEIEVNSETILDAADFEFTSTYLIQLTAAGVAKLDALYGTLTSVPMLIRRRTQISSRLVDFQDSSTLTEEDLDLNSNQLFYLLQEVYDSAELGNFQFNPVDGAIDLDGAQLVDVGAPTGESHAATLGTVLDNAITPDYTEAASYRVGRMVFYNGDLYRANTATLSAPAVFDAGSWDLIFTDEQIALIATNQTDIGDNATAIGVNAAAIIATADAITTHAALSNTHGVSGAIVGTNNAQVMTNKTFDDKVTLKELAVTPSTPASGYKAIYPKDDGKFYTLDDSGNEVEIGSGGTGDAFAIHLVEAENLLTIADADLTGNNSDFDGGGTVTASSLTLSTTAADLIKGEKVISYVPGADGSDDYFGFTKTIPTGLRGRDIGFVFEYKNDSTVVDDDFRFCVKQKDGGSAGSVNYYNMSAYNTANDNSVLFNVSSFIEGDCTEIEFGFQNTSSTTTVELHVDNILVTTNPFIYSDLMDYQEGRWDGAAGHGSTNTKIPYFTNERATRGTGIVTFDNDSTLGFSVTATRDCKVHLQFWGRQSGNNQIGASIDNAEFTPTLTTDIGSVTEANGALGFVNNMSGEFGYFSAEILLRAGDVIRPHTNGNLNAFGGVNIIAEATTKHIMTPVENSIVTVIAGGNDGAAISSNSEDINWTVVTDENNAFDGEEYTVQGSNSEIHVSWGVRLTGGGTSTGILLYVNGSFVRRVYSTPASNAHYSGYFHIARGEVSKDDTFSLRTASGFTLSNDSDFHHLRISEHKDAKLLSAIPSGSSLGTPGTTVDNSILRWSGTDGDTIQAYTSGAPTITDTGGLRLDGGNDVTTTATPTDLAVTLDSTGKNGFASNGSGNNLAIYNNNSRVFYVSTTAVEVGSSFQFKTENGLVSKPVFSFKGMTDGGIYRDSGTDTLRMAINGVDSMTWDDDFVSTAKIFGPGQYATGSLPAAASYEGYIAYDTTTQTMKYSDGTSWISM